MQANQPYDAGTTADVIPCPDLSSSPVGSSKLDDCECGEGLTKEYEYNLDDGTRANFACYCDKGKYLNRTDTPYKCLKCVICEPRFYKKGCEKESPGTCTPCQVCASASQKLAGCGLLSADVCQDKEELVRTPWCPVADESKSPGNFRTAGVGPRFVHIRGGLRLRRAGRGLCVQQAVRRRGIRQHPVRRALRVQRQDVRRKECSWRIPENMPCGDGSQGRPAIAPRQTTREMCVVQRLWPLGQ